MTVTVSALAAALGAAAIATAAPGEADQCLAAKLKEVGKYEACRFKAASVAALKAVSPDIDKCETKFSDAWQKAEAKFGLDCPTNGDETSIHATAGSHVDVIVATLKNEVPVCGNGVTEAGEECDGASLNGETCVSRGFDDGTLACSPTCTFDQTGCVVQECDVFAQTGCAAGQACYPLGQNQLCAGEGTAVEGETCVYVNSCVAGTVCINTISGNQCATFCDSIDNDPSCGAGQTCVNAVEGTNIGVCVTP